MIGLMSGGLLATALFPLQPRGAAVESAPGECARPGLASIFRLPCRGSHSSRLPSWRTLMAYSYTEKKRIRKDFGKLPHVLHETYLLAIQLYSYRKFLLADADKDVVRQLDLHP